MSVINSLINNDQISELTIYTNNKNFTYDNIKISYVSNYLTLLSYDLVGLIYYLSLKTDLTNANLLFKKKNTFKGKIGVFDIKDNKINHRLNFYQVENGKLKEIF